MKRRLDERLVAEDLAPTVERARALILSGVVLVDDRPVTTAGTRIADHAVVRFKSGAGDDWASRGAHKLQPALHAFGVPVSGRRCLDVGASTGGFTDVLLREGAASVLAVDVGYGQLAWRLRQDERVTVVERFNARHLTRAEVPDPVDVVVMDVSFISVTAILPAVVPLTSPDADLLIMVKPQFELDRAQVGSGGVVRDPALRARAVDQVVAAVAPLGLREQSRRDNDISGPKGNLETFLHLARRR